MAQREKRAEKKKKIGSVIKCNLSEWIGKRRTNQAQVAREAGVSTTTIHQLYHDKWGGIDRHTMAQLCRVLDCSPGDLFTYEPRESDKTE